MYQVKFICRKNGEILKEKLSSLKWDTRDSAQLYAITKFKTVLGEDEFQEYFVTGFEIINTDEK